MCSVKSSPVTLEELGGGGAQREPHPPHRSVGGQEKSPEPVGVFLHLRTSGTGRGLPSSVGMPRKWEFGRERLRCECGLSSGLSLPLCFPAALCPRPSSPQLSDFLFPALSPTSTTLGCPCAIGPIFQCCPPPRSENPLPACVCALSCPAGCRPRVISPAAAAAPHCSLFLGSQGGGRPGLPACALPLRAPFPTPASCIFPRALCPLGPYTRPPFPRS